MSRTRLLQQSLRSRYAPGGGRQYSQAQLSTRLRIPSRSTLGNPSSFNSTRPIVLRRVRYQSTVPDRAAAVLEELRSAAPPTTNNASTLFEQLAQTASSTASAATPHLGMLKEAGLDFGWGPTAITQWLVEHLHVTAGLPWWGALVGTALLYRALFLWPMVRSSHHAAIAQAIAPAQREIRQRYKGLDMDPRQVMLQQQTEMKYLAKQTGYKMSAHFAPLILQGVLSFGVFRLCRNMSLTDGLGLSDGGIGWISNLYLADPYFILPGASTVMLYVMARNNMRRAMASGSSALPPTHWLSRTMVYGLPLVSFFIMFRLAAVVQLPLATLSITASLTQNALYNPWLRRTLGISSFHDKPKSSAMPPQPGTPQVVDVQARNKTATATATATAAEPTRTSAIARAAAAESGGLEAFMERLGLGGAAGAATSSSSSAGRSGAPPGSAGAKEQKKQTRLEEMRGKEAVLRAQEYSRQRRRRQSEQSMRDRI